MGVHISFQVNAFIFFGKYPEVEVLHHIKVFFLRFYPILSFGTDSSASSFCLTLCVRFHTVYETTNSPGLEEVALCSR